MAVIKRITGSTIRPLMLSACLGLATLSGGCGIGGIDGVELQGGVFDALGVSGSGNDKKLADAKVEARPGLVLPPSTEQLPQPVTGSLAAAPQGGEAWPRDPEDLKKQNKAEAARRHKEHCEQAIQRQRMNGESGPVMGPLGNCQPGLFGMFTKSSTGQ